MAKFLFTVLPLPGHLFPQISIAHALRERGHECAFYTGSRGGKVLQGEGFLHFPFQHFSEENLYKTLFSGNRGGMSLTGWRQYSKMLRDWLLGTIPGQIADIEPLLTSWKPDVIVTDVSVWGPILVLWEKTGIPVALSSFVPGCMVPGPDAPPFGLGLPRPRDFRTRLISQVVRISQDMLAGGFRREVTDIRRAHGLAPIHTSVPEFTGKLPLHLVRGTAEFDYDRHDLPPSVHYVGACEWNSPQHEGPATWLDELPKDRPWVHVSEGTVHVGKPFLMTAAAEGLANRGMEVIMSTGGDRQPEEMGLGNLAANIHLVRWVSHSELMPKTAAMVTTGGAGTVLAALVAGVPLVITPTEWDKPEIAQRVVEFGAGLRIEPRKCTPTVLRAAVERLLNEPSFRKQAQKLAELFRNAGGPDYAASLLEKLVR
ncbi:MAG: nucleotide disphospho-sugar-binding domain-containing protein [Bryobacteraceae bacterium]